MSTDDGPSFREGRSLVGKPEKSRTVLLVRGAITGDAGRSILAQGPGIRTSPINRTRNFVHRYYFN